MPTVQTVLGPVETADLAAVDDQTIARQRGRERAALGSR